MAGGAADEGDAGAPAPLEVSALGVPVRIVLGPSVPLPTQREIRDAWSGATTDASSPDPITLGVELIEPGSPLPAGAPTPGADLIAGSPASLGADLSTRVTLAAIGARRGRLLMLHAAGIAAEDGRVIAFVGPSGRGKSTLARALGRAFAYVSDETVGIAEDGSVLPYRKPLSLVRDEPGPKAQLSPAALGLRDLPAAPLRLAAIVLVDRDAEAEPGFVLEPVPLAHAVPELVAQTSYLGDFPLPLQRIAGHIRATGGILRLRYRDVAELEGLVPAVLDRLVPAVVDAAPADAAVARSGRPGIRRAEVRDALPTEDGLLLFHEGTVHLLDGIGPALWTAAAAGADRAGLLRAALAAHDSPGPDASAWSAVTAALDALTEAGLLITDPAGFSRADAAAWARSPDCAAVDGGDRVAVLDLTAPGAEAPRLLEGTAAQIWRAATVRDTEPGATTDEIVVELAARFGAPESEIRDDVEGFLTELEARRLLTRIPPGGPALG